MAVTVRIPTTLRPLAGGNATVEVEGATVGEVLAEARRRFGDPLAHVLQGCKVWHNGEPCTDATPVAAGDEVAVLPPVSGG